MSCENYMSFKFQSPNIKFNWNTAMLICLCSVHRCFLTTRAELSSWMRDWPSKPKIFTIWPYCNRWIFISHCKLADVIITNICIMPCSLKNTFTFLILLIIHNNSVNILCSYYKLDMQSLTYWFNSPWYTQPERRGLELNGNLLTSNPT